MQRAGNSISARMRVTSASTMPAYPYSKPACIDWTVLRATTLPGRASSTRGSFAACSYRASALIWTPGAMTPPMYSPLGLMTSHVVAVPKSTTMQPALISSNAATALTMRSAPTSRGFS